MLIKNLLYLYWIFNFPSFSTNIDAQDSYIYASCDTDIIEISESTRSKRSLLSKTFPEFSNTSKVIYSMTYNADTNSLYFSTVNASHSIIYKMAMIGTEPANLTVFFSEIGSFFYSGLEMDSNKGYLYVTWINKEIFRINSDGKNKENIFSYEFLGAGFIFDKYFRFLYWFQFGANSGIYRTEIDMASSKTSIIKPKLLISLNNPDTVVYFKLDFQKNLIYWRDASFEAFWSSSVEGTYTKILFNFTNKFFDFYIFSQKIYFIDNTLKLWVFDPYNYQMQIHSEYSCWARNLNYRPSTGKNVYDSSTQYLLQPLEILYIVVGGVLSLMTITIIAIACHCCRRKRNDIHIAPLTNIISLEDGPQLAEKGHEYDLIVEQEEVQFGTISVVPERKIDQDDAFKGRNDRLFDEKHVYCSMISQNKDQPKSMVVIDTEQKFDKVQEAEISVDNIYLELADEVLDPAHSCDNFISPVRENQTKLNKYENVSDTVKDQDDTYLQIKNYQFDEKNNKDPNN